MQGVKSSFMSFPRKRESISRAAWIPAFAGMTDEWQSIQILKMNAPDSMRVSRQKWLKSRAKSPSPSRVRGSSGLTE
jgi:hypothetical protein